MDNIMIEQTISPQFNISDLKLYECGREKCCPVKDIQSYAKTYHMLHFILNGKGVFEMGGNRYDLEKRDIFYIPPGTEAHYYPDLGEPWTYIWIGFDGDGAKDYLSECSLSPANPVMRNIRDASLSDYLSELVYSYNHTGVLDIKCIGFVYIIFSILISHANSDEVRSLTPKESHVKEAKEFILNNFQFPITVQNMADSVNLTTNYLSDIFKEVVGISPKQYLTKFRIDKACAMLSADPQIRIKDVAAHVGYSNQLHFSSEFKKVKGISPKFYQDKRTRMNQRRNSE